MTPEHMQLLSDKKLKEAAEEKTTSEAPNDMKAALARMARYEIRRRRGDVPVRDRYGHV